jgi:hypothetical protein
MSQVAKSASAFVRAFLAVLVLELEDMAVQLVRSPKLARVHGYRWTVRLRHVRICPPPLSVAVNVFFARGAAVSFRIEAGRCLTPSKHWSLISKQISVQDVKF